MEIVLSPLFLRTRRGAGFPETSILDYGCGEGDLLKALRTFSRQILSRIRYVGLDLDPAKVEAAKLVAEETDVSLSRTTPLARSMAECRVIPHSEVTKLPRSSFDIVHVVNLMHHLVELEDIHSFFTNTTALLKRNGFLIVEDFFFGSYPANLDWEHYTRCNGAVFWGPAELGAMLFLATREVGSYRFFERHKRPPTLTPEGAEPRPTRWFGFTYVHRMYGESIGGLHDYFSRGYHYALQRMLTKTKAADRRGAPGYADYLKILKPLLQKAEGFTFVPWPRDRYPKKRDDELGMKLKKLYDYEDPFPAHHARAALLHRQAR